MEQDIPEAGSSSPCEFGRETRYPQVRSPVEYVRVSATGTVYRKETLIGKDTDQKIELLGQVAIVTGGGRGIGRTIAPTLAEAGAAVAVVARSEDQLEEAVSLVEVAGARSRFRQT